MTRWGELDGRYEDIEELDRQRAEWSRICAEVKAAEVERRRRFHGAEGIEKP